MFKKLNDLSKQLILFLINCIGIFIVSNYVAAATFDGIKVYQKDVHLSPEHKQRLAADITRYRTADNIWNVLREGFALPHYKNNPLVRDKIEWYMNNQDFILRATARAAPYLYYILGEVRKRHLPAEVALLPIIESGYNPFAISNMGASGLWQMMPDTATGLGIRQDTWYDGRRDVIASTHGALSYLSYLRSFFEGNWLLAIAAYNTGEGNVLAAIKRNIRNGRDTDFWSLPVAQQTRDYVPSLLALAIIISDPDQYPIYFPPVRNAPYLAQVDVGKQINLKYAASLAGMSYKKLIQLNPGFNQVTTSKRGPYKLVLPIENIEQFSENLARSPFNKSLKWFHYKVKTGDTLIAIAKKFNSSLVAMRKLNHLENNLLKPGSNLLIPNNPAEKLDAVITPTKLVATKSLPKKKPIAIVARNKPTITSKNLLPKVLAYRLQPGDTIYMVRTKDTLESIAKRFKVNKELLYAANHLTSTQLKLGAQLIIPTHSNTANQAITKDKIYVVKKGDTLNKIALKFRTTTAAIRLINLIDDNSLLEGERIVVPTQLRG